MTDKEKEAIEHFNNLNHLYEIGVDNLKYTESEYDNSKILLNLIKTLKRDFEIVDHECSRLEQEDIKKDMIIDLMAEQLTTPVHNKEWVINYYTKEIEKV